MAIKQFQKINATMQMRRGMEQDFDPDQMTTGEWAVSTDSKKVWMCFAPGIVIRMSTYEAFEEDMLEIQKILATCQDIHVAVEAFEALAEKHKDDAENFAKKSQSYAVGGTGIREGEDSDNAKYYYEQSKNISQGIGGALIPMGTVSFENLPSISDVENGWMYNVSDQFVTTEEFNEGSGNVIPSGSNVYKTAEGKWDILAGTPVTSVDGMTGNVVLDYLEKDGDSSNTTVTFEQATQRANVLPGDDLATAFRKLSKYCADLKTVAFTGEYSDLTGSPALTTSLAVTEEGVSALDGTVGKTLNDKITQINSDLQGFTYLYSNDATKSVKELADSMPKNCLLVHNAWSVLADYPTKYGGIWTLEILKGNSRDTPKITLSDGKSMFLGYYHIGKMDAVEWRQFSLTKVNI